MEFQYHNILVPGSFEEPRPLVADDNKTFLNIIIIAVLLTAVYYMYKQYVQEEERHLNG